MRVGWGLVELFLSFSLPFDDFLSLDLTALRIFRFFCGSLSGLEIFSSRDSLVLDFIFDLGSSCCSYIFNSDLWLGESRGFFGGPWTDFDLLSLTGLGLVFDFPAEMVLWASLSRLKSMEGSDWITLLVDSWLGLTLLLELSRVMDFDFGFLVDFFFEFWIIVLWRFIEVRSHEGLSGFEFDDFLLFLDFFSFFFLSPAEIATETLESSSCRDSWADLARFDFLTFESEIEILELALDFDLFSLWISIFSRDFAGLELRKSGFGSTLVATLKS